MLPGDTRYLEIKSDKKAIIWKKLFNLSENDLNSFKPLFNKVENLFDI